MDDIHIQVMSELDEDLEKEMAAFKTGQMHSYKTHKQWDFYSRRVTPSPASAPGLLVRDACKYSGFFWFVF